MAEYIRKIGLKSKVSYPAYVKKTAMIFSSSFIHGRREGTFAEGCVMV